MLFGESYRTSKWAISIKPNFLVWVGSTPAAMAVVLSSCHCQISGPHPSYTVTPNTKQVPVSWPVSPKGFGGSHHMGKLDQLLTKFFVLVFILAIPTFVLIFPYHAFCIQNARKHFVFSLYLPEAILSWYRKPDNTVPAYPNTPGATAFSLYIWMISISQVHIYTHNTHISFFFCIFYIWDKGQNSIFFTD